MKKTFLFVAALACSATMFSQEIINTWVNDELAVDQEWVSGTAYPTFEFDEYISCGTTGSDNGVFYETDKALGDWRVYRARGEGEGKFWIAAEGAKINKVSFTQYGAAYSKGGGLLSTVPGVGLTDSIASDSVLVFAEPVDSVILYAGTSNDPDKDPSCKVSAQLRIQRFFIEYTINGTGLKRVLGVDLKNKKIVRDGMIFIQKDEKEINMLGF